MSFYLNARNQAPLLLLLFSGYAGAADKSSKGQLYETLRALDSALFDSYNKCDLEKNRTFLADDVEFYHDQAGLTVGADALTESLRRNICGKTRRELVSGSLVVHPIKGYGAVQLGIHRFFTPASAAEPSGEAKFIHLWRLKEGVWKLTRVISYDHAAVKR